MFIRFIFLLILLGGPLAETVWADKDDRSGDHSVAPVVAPTIAPIITAAPEQSAVIPERGALYRIRYQDHTSYLFGTVHVGRPQFFPLETLATQALAEADTVALELDMRDTASIANSLKKYGMYAGNDTLDKHLSPAGLAGLRQVLAQTGMPFDRVAHLKAWVVADLLLVAALEQQGYHSEEGVDMFLLKSAVAQGKPILGLESADFQMSLFNSMTEKQQENYLNENLADIQSGVALKKAQELENAWASADKKTFNQFLRDIQTDRSTSGRFMQRVLLNKRNPALAGKIEALLKQEQHSFVGIGLLHLIGKDGVPQLLARRGYEVTQLY